MKDNFDLAIDTLKEWIKIKSVKGDSAENYPFGKNIGLMLEKALSDAEKLGFKTVNYDNYIGEIVWGEGNDKEGLAILSHLDVVPEGDLSSWIVPPYSAEIKDGRLYGRGVLDDKGAAVICLYAMKELKDEGFYPSRKIKLILGCDEESGWGCIDHYKEKAIMPREGFSPDADFPVIYSEKGIIHAEYEFDISEKIIDIYGGDRTNVVPDKAYLKLEKYNDIDLCKYDLKEENNNIIAEGKATHGSTPEKGINAIKKLMKFLSDFNYIDKDIYIKLFENNLGLIEDETGKLTFSPNVIRKENEKIYVKVDIRYPATKDYDYIISELKKLGKFNVIHYQAPLYNDKNSEYVNIYVNAYNMVTNENSKPIAIGGGTYARALEKGVGFGPNFGDGECHIANENMKIDDLKKCFLIYKETIKNLTK